MSEKNKEFNDYGGFISGDPLQSTGDAFREALRSLAERKNISLNEAAKFFEKDLVDRQSEEHLGFLREALRELTEGA